MLMMKSLAQVVAAHGIRVNGIALGAVETPINQEAWEMSAAERKLLELIPYGRLGEPENVAKAAVWLVSNASDYVVGTTFFADGAWPFIRGSGKTVEPLPY
mgnify:CR=1 FL=1